jgi:hypothetical protein
VCTHCSNSLTHIATEAALRRHYRDYHLQDYSGNSVSMRRAAKKLQRKSTLVDRTLGIETTEMETEENNNKEDDSISTKDSTSETGVAEVY